VLNALGGAALNLRAKLGESLASVQRFDTPLPEATAFSLEALQAYSLGRKVLNETGPATALPYRQRAIELDPNFSMGYLSGRQLPEYERDWPGAGVLRQGISVAGTYHPARSVSQSSLESGAYRGRSFGVAWCYVICWEAKKNQWHSFSLC
jgi:hypothetical protein